MSVIFFDRKLSTPWHIVIVFDRSQYYRETAALYFSDHLLLETHLNPSYLLLIHRIRNGTMSIENRCEIDI